jgi:hypothetical protein
LVPKNASSTGTARNNAELLLGEEEYPTRPDWARAVEASIPGSHLTVVSTARYLASIDIPERVASMHGTVTKRKESSRADRQ